MDDLGERSQAVGGARGVGDDLNVALVALLVDTHDEHWSISRWGGDDDLLGASLDVSTSLLLLVVRMEPSFLEWDRMCGAFAIRCSNVRWW